MKHHNKPRYPRNSYVKWNIDDRIIVVNGKITFLTFTKVAHALVQLQDRSFQPILLLIRHSQGGCAFSGFMICQLLRGTIAPVYTVVENLAESAALLIFLGGYERFMLCNAHIRPHQVILSSANVINVSEQTAEQFRDYLHEFNDSLSELSHFMTGIPKKIAGKLCRENEFLSAREARHYNFATKIMYYKKFNEIFGKYCKPR